MDDFDEFSIPPAWRLRFVHDEVRPVLIRLRSETLAAFERWLASRQNAAIRRRIWELRLDSFLREVDLATELHRFTDDGNPIESYWAQMTGSAFVNGVLFDSDTGKRHLFRVDGPPELADENSPPQYDVSPLPPPTHRDVTSDECFVAMMAIHDESRIASEAIGPTEGNEYYFLRRKVKKLTEENLPDLRKQLSIAVASVQNLTHAEAPSKLFEFAIVEPISLPTAPLSSTDFALSPATLSPLSPATIKSDSAIDYSRPIHPSDLLE